MAISKSKDDVGIPSRHGYMQGPEEHPVSPTIIWSHAKEDPENEEDGDFTNNINPRSLVVLHDVPVEPALAAAAAGSRFQFMRKGYFYLDPEDAKVGRVIYNRTVGLRDSWGKKKKKK